MRLTVWERVARLAHHYPGWIYNPAQWPTRDGYMPFRLFLVFEAEYFAHAATARISATVAARYATGGARKENGDYTDEFRGDMERARLLAPLGR